MRFHEVPVVAIGCSSSKHQSVKVYCCSHHSLEIICKYRQYFRTVFCRANVGSQKKRTQTNSLDAASYGYTTSNLGTGRISFFLLTGSKLLFCLNSPRTILGNRLSTCFWIPITGCGFRLDGEGVVDDFFSLAAVGGSPMGGRK